MAAPVIPSLPNYGGGGSPFAGSAAGVAAAYGQGYANSLNFANAQKSAIDQGYRNVLDTQARQFKTISKGYGTLSDDVLNRIAGTDAAAKQDIADRYAQSRGASTQGLINAGLGNSTVTSAVQRGLSLDENKAYTNLADQMAQLSANYQSQIGLAGLGFRGNATLANSQLAQNQLQWMNSIQAQYPDPGVYAQMAQMYASQDQASKDRRALMNAYSGYGGGGGAGAQGLGYTPRPAPGHYNSEAPQGMPSGPSQFYNPLTGGIQQNSPAYTAPYGQPQYGQNIGGTPAWVHEVEHANQYEPGAGDYGGGGDFGGEGYDLSGLGFGDFAGAVGGYY